MSDYKYAIQMIAEEMAMDRYETEYEDLDGETQERLYVEATERYADRMCAGVHL